jgi:chemotaxis protein MotA
MPWFPEFRGRQERTGEVSADKASLAGIALAVGGILAGLLLEGGNMRQVLQPTAAMIVFGGTAGAVMI